MKKLLPLVLMVACCVILTACSTPAKRVRDIKLGMTPDEIIDVMGKPYTIRASKLYESGEWTEIWEYLPPALTLNPKTFWIYFENGKVVQWGEPGDFAGKSGRNVPVAEYSEQKVLR